MNGFWVMPDGVLRDGAMRKLDVQRHLWERDAHENGLGAGRPCSGVQAVRHLVSQGSRRLCVGVIGPNDASETELVLAARTGTAIAGLGLPMICGGRGGCMEAASRGHAEAGGLVIGILPSADWRDANPYVTIPVATGIGEARNAIIASACFALVAVGGGHGTLSEMALGLKLERLVIAMPPAAMVNGAKCCDTVEAAMEAIAQRYLGLGGEGLFA